MQVVDATPGLFPMTSSPLRDGPTVGSLLTLLLLLWLAGVALRMTILAMPPVIPLVHVELGLSETQVGFLIGLPLAVFALAAVPGSLLIARIGARHAVVLGMVIAALAGGSRGAAIDIWTLSAATIATGFGIAIMQPGLPTLVNEWMPERVALGTISYTGGMLIGSMLAASLTIPFVLPLVGGSWRLDLVAWALPALVIPPVFLGLSPKTGEGTVAQTFWWPDWKNPLVWLLGLTFGGNNSPFFATNAFLGDYLIWEGRGDLLAGAMAWLNSAQIMAPLVLLVLADRLQGRAWPFLLFGPLLLVAFLGLIFGESPLVIEGSAGLVGFTTAITLTAILALPPLLCTPADLPRTTAGMLTISYATAIIVPTVCGALWDATARPWTVFLPLCICAVVMTVLGTIVTRYPAAGEKGKSA
jgi:MFS transporter, CP family, cyanate transporter